MNPPEQTTGGPPDGEEQTARRSAVTTRLRLYFFAPLTLVLICIAAAWVLTLYLHERAEIGYTAERIRSSVSRLYDADVRHGAEMLDAVMQVLRRDEGLRDALADRDRGRLLARSAPLFTDLHGRFGITHFYFSGPDRANLLRVHQPERHGDVINRITTLEAGRTGTTFSGVELGPLGTLTLRLVDPWYADAARTRLLGYVELGMEIDHVLHGSRHFLEVPIFVLISKAFLRRVDWECGMKMLGRESDWERFPDAVLSTQAAQAIPPALAAHFAQAPLGTGEADFSVDRSFYRTVSVPLREAGGRTVGRIVAMIDLSQQIRAMRRAGYTAGVAALAAAAALLVFFYWLVGRIGRRIGYDEWALAQANLRLAREATTDALTRAFNRRKFDELLMDELQRTSRHGLPLSLVMFDIDYFKRVNDTYGHQAGDDLLWALSLLVGTQIRQYESLARWGGEEFMILAPNCDLDVACKEAERLRQLIEDANFGAVGRITCSFGVTQCRAGDTAETITARADQALYAAKQGGRNRVEVAY